MVNNSLNSANKHVGIVTYYNIYNYGSYLQAYALSSFLIDSGYSVDLLDIYYSQRMKWIFKIKKLIKMLCYPRYFSQVIELRKMGTNTKDKIDSKTKELFDSETTQYLKAVRIDYCKLKRLAKTNAYYAFIVGSDQIWSPLGFDIKPHKFLEFAPRGKRLSYAPSFGVSYVPDYNKYSFKKQIKKMDVITIRENSGAKIIRELTNIDAPVVLDPTLMIPKSVWYGLTHDIEEHYVLCFFLGTPDKFVIELIEYLSKKENLKIVFLPYDNEIGTISNAHRVSIGPLEFLSYVKNADYVLTDSFHGTAFSIIFERTFYVFPRYKKMTYKQATRITDILGKLGLEEHFILDETSDCFGKAIDYNKVNDKLEMLRTKSQNILLKSLRDIPNE